MKIKAIYVVILLLFSVFNSIVLGSYHVKDEGNNNVNSLCDVKTILGNPTYDSFDWRDAFIDEEIGFGMPGNGQGYDWTTRIKNQGYCGCCYAFGTLAVLESVAKIKLNRPDLDVDLSEQFIVTCGKEWSDNDDFLGCNGVKNQNVVYEFIENEGAIPECFFKYISRDSDCYIGRCSFKYSDYEDFTVDISEWGFVDPNIEDIKERLIEYGPLSASMDVYSNLESYNGGIYEHGGQRIGTVTHTVTIVGYDDTNNCWICKNSLGTNWGEDGWFRIRYGECKIEENVIYVCIGDFPDDIIEFNLDFTMHRIKQIDEIDPFYIPFVYEDKADWSYRVSVYNGLVLEHKSKKYCDEEDDHTEDVTHTFHIHSLTTTPTIIVKLWDTDSVLKDHDLADISSKSGGGRDNNIDDYRKAMLHFKYDVINDEVIPIDNVIESSNGEYYTSEGDGNNRAKIWFKINKNEDFDPEASVADLSCSGSLSWSDAQPNGSILGEFTVENIGDSGSNLEWMVSDYPTWGSWSFDPMEDSCLTPEDGPFVVNVNVTAPNDPGATYSGEIVIINKYDGSDFGTILVTLSTGNPPEIPTILRAPNEAYIGDNVAFHVTSYDADADGIDYYFDWGDGNISGWDNYYRDSGQEVVGTHIWTCEGTYEVKIKAKDEKGLESGFITTSINIVEENFPPNKPTISGDSQGQDGSSHEFWVCAIDPNEDSVSYYIEWGDGETTGWTSFYNSNQSVCKSHTFPDLEFLEKNHPYSVRVKAKDEEGLESVWSDPFPFTLPKNKLGFFTRSFIFDMLHSFLIQNKRFDAFSKLFDFHLIDG